MIISRIFGPITLKRLFRLLRPKTFVRALKIIFQMLYHYYTSKILTYKQLNSHLPKSILKTLNCTQTTTFLNLNRSILTNNKVGGGA